MAVGTATHLAVYTGNALWGVSLRVALTCDTGTTASKPTTGDRMRWAAVMWRRGCGGSCRGGQAEAEALFSFVCFFCLRTAAAE